MKSIRGVLLDIDGTLVDSNDAHAHAWVDALAEGGRTVAFDVVRRLIGKGGDKLLPEISGVDAESAEGKKIGERRGEIFKQKYLPALRPTPGAGELLALFKARGLRRVVASSAKEAELGPLLAVCGGGDLVESATTSDDADNSKPDPDIIRAALGRIGLSADEVLMLGDTPYDIEAAGKAGVRTVALRCGGWGDAGLAGAEAVYDDPHDLARRFEDTPFGRGE